MIEPRFLNLIDSFFQLLFYFSLAYLSGVIIYLGIIYITTSGDKLKEVHKKLPLILIGAVFIFLSLTIPKLIGLFFGLDIELAP
jgi:hypothetical protein